MKFGRDFNRELSAEELPYLNYGCLGEDKVNPEETHGAVMDAETRRVVSFLSSLIAGLPAERASGGAEERRGEDVVGSPEGVKDGRDGGSSEGGA